MSGKRCVFVLGAGSSAELGLPTGLELKDRIAEFLNIELGVTRGLNTGDYLTYESIRLASEQGHTDSAHPAFRTAQMIRDAMPQALSIDNFIDAHRGNKSVESVGKISIVRSILEAEKNSSIFVDYNGERKHFDFHEVKNTWLNKFVQLVTENCQLEQLRERLSRYAFIVFNYDRCLEHFLFHSFQNYFRIDPNSAAELVKLIEIYHPYGKVGNLQWELNEPSILFGSDPSAVEIVELQKRIRTFTEGTDPKRSNIDEIRRCVGETEILVFLGFAFHPLNMELLKSNIIVEFRKKCFATAYGISDFNTQIIESEIPSLFGDQRNTVHIRNDLKCAQLLDDFWRGIAK